MTTLGLHLKSNRDRIINTYLSHTTLDKIEQQAIEATLARFNGHRAKTAMALDIGLRTLGMKLKKYAAVKHSENDLARAAQSTEFRL